MFDTYCLHQGLCCWSPRLICKISSQITKLRPRVPFPSRGGFASRLVQPHKCFNIILYTVQLPLWPPFHTLNPFSSSPCMLTYLLFCPLCSYDDSRRFILQTLNLLEAQLFWCSEDTKGSHLVICEPRITGLLYLYVWPSIYVRPVQPDGVNVRTAPPLWLLRNLLWGIGFSNNNVSENVCEIEYICKNADLDTLLRGRTRTLWWAFHTMFCHVVDRKNFLLNVKCITDIKLNWTSSSS